MRIEPGEAICGISPAILKKVFQQERFDTLRLMRIADIGEPRASNCLRCLAEGGWVSFVKTRDGVDQWKTGPSGHRLLATRLIKRFRVREGREIVARVVAEAGRINRDPTRSCRVAAIYLFGSVLTGDDDDLAGDVDLVIDVERRRLPKSELKEIEKRELPDRFMDYWERFSWPSNSILRQLKRVSTKITIHGRSDLELLGPPYRQVYAYSVTKEAEEPFDAQIRRFDRNGSGEVEAQVVVPPAKSPRPWPSQKDAEQPVNMDTEDAALIEHLWINGLNVQDIAAKCHADDLSVTAFLATRHDRADRGPVVFDPALDRMLAPYVIKDDGWSKLVEVRVGRHAIASIDLFTRPDWKRGGCMRIVSRDSGRFNDVPAGMLGEVENLGRAARLWWAKMQPKATGLSVEAAVFLDPDREYEQPRAGPPLDFRPLRPAMVEALDRLWEHPREEYGGYDRRIEVDFYSPESVQIRYCIGYRWHPDYKDRRVRKAIALPIRAVLDPLLEKWAPVLSKSTHYKISVDGSLLDASGETSEE